MKFKVSKDHFVTGLQQVMNIVSTRATMPILGNVLIIAKEGGLALTTTNLDLGIRCQITAEVMEEGAITLPVRKLATIIRELPQAEVLVEVSKKNQAKITSGGSIFRIMGIDEEQFPALPDFENRHTFTLQQDELATMLRSVSYAQSSDENRYILNGVYFAFEDEKLNLVATDGRRLALINKEMEVAAGSIGNFILPAKTVVELERSLGKGDSVTIAFNERQVAFELKIGEVGETSGLMDNLYLVSKIVDGNYPNFRQVIPKETTHRVKLERDLMLDCVKRAALVVSDKNHSVTLKITKNLLEIMGSSPEFGESHESMAIPFEEDIEVRVAFNPSYLMEPLKALDNDEVFFEFKDELSPGLFKNMGSFLCVVMPLRLNN